MWKLVTPLTPANLPVPLTQVARPSQRASEVIVAAVAQVQSATAWSPSPSVKTQRPRTSSIVVKPQEKLRPS